MASLTIDVRAADGALWTGTDGRTVTITIRPPSGVLRPRGPKAEIVKRSRAARRAGQPTQEALERIAAWVSTWSGLGYNGTPLACTQDVLLAVLENAPHIREQVERAIHDLSTSGLL